MKINCKRIIALFLSLALCAVSLPLMIVPVTADHTDSRVADPSTMNDWQHYFGKTVLSTQNAGGVWTDKSVFTDTAAFEGSGITLADDHFLVALSAIASDKTVDGFSNVPTDTVLVLDVSDSLYGADQNLDIAEQLVRAVNQTVDKLQAINRNNRVGVVVYGGEDHGQSQTDNAAVLLPLDRYTYSVADEQPSVLEVTVTDAKRLSLRVSEAVKNGKGEIVSAEYTVADRHGAYMQCGLLTALDEMLQADTIVPADEMYATEQTRIPVLVTVNSGATSVATARYTERETAGLCNTASDSHNTAQIEFVTQLTAAYVKEMLDEHYKETQPLMYTLSLGGDVSRNVTDPRAQDRDALKILADPSSYSAQDLQAASVNRTIDTYWDLLLSDGSVGITVQNCQSDGDTAAENVTYDVKVTDITVDGEQAVFPSNKEKKYYVDEAFYADTADTIADTLLAVVQTVDAKSQYFPTLVDGDEEMSGYVSFVDRIGDYMNVTDIKGIMIDNTLFSGAMLSRNFIMGGGDLGTFDAPTSLGDELVWAVQDRLGVDVNTARDLLGLAYYYGQLRYVDDDDFSNYIGWYANRAGEFLGFWHEGIETMPDPADPTLTDATRPAFIIRSYGFLGAVDNAHGVTESDMLYATVQIREDIESGEELVAFAVPAALIPTVTYTLIPDENGNVTDMTVGGAEHPIRLVYEVGMDEAIDAVSVTEVVDNGYVHKSADGVYTFYTNRFEADGTVGYGKTNTYSYFTPAYHNERYYYTEDTLIYADANGTPYTGEKPQSTETYYHSRRVYEKTASLVETVIYEPISDISIAKAVLHGDGYWYIPKGTAFTMLAPYVNTKTENNTNALAYSNVPFVDAQYTYYVGATLGNNGCVSVVPETGLQLTNRADGAAEDVLFDFVITADAEETARYDAVVTDADGTRMPTAVSFADGIAHISLKNGESLYILGMTDGAAYTVSQRPHTDCKVIAVNGNEGETSVNVKVTANTFAKAVFENTLKGSGDVVIVKRVQHGFGSTYQIPEKQYQLEVDLGESFANQTLRAAHSTDVTVEAVTADENGRFTVSLKHTEQFELFGVKEDTIVTVTEIDTPSGFVPVYYGAGVKDQNFITVKDGESVPIVVMNTYTPNVLNGVNIAVGGTKYLNVQDSEWSDTDVFEFALQKHSDGEWQTIATAQADKHDHTFNFNDVMSAQVFLSQGVYHYQVVEVIGDAKDMLYDRTIHSFSVEIGDPQMNGQLEVLRVATYDTQTAVGKDGQGDWFVTTDFTNRYLSDHRAVAVLDISKQMINDSNSDRVNLAGFCFGLYEDGAAQPTVVSARTDRIGEARLVAEFDTAGIYTYSLKEVIPADTVKGMVYSEEVYTVTVTVEEDSEGVLSAAVAVSKDGSPYSGVPTFTNRYELDEAHLAVAVRTELVGRDLQDGEFTFVIKNGDAVLATGTNDSEGAVAFDQDLVFKQVGHYYYDVAQVKGDIGGITYDTHTYHLHITVTDDGEGALCAEYHVVNALVNEIVFENVYTPQSVSVKIEGRKVLTGRTLLNEEFHFMLIQQGVMPPKLYDASNYSDGTFSFDVIEFDAVGTYTYTVQEVQQTTTHGIVFDKTMYDVYVEVTDDFEGNLNAEVTYVKNGDEAAAIVFENCYVPTPIRIGFEGVAFLDEQPPENVFSFVLIRADEQWRETKTLETVSNLSDGSFVFSDIEITNAGVYRYLIKEIGGGQTVDGVTYDDEVYHILVTVTDNGRGALTVEKGMVDSKNVHDLDFVAAFYNSYAVSGDAAVTVGGSLNLDGRDVQDGEFTFELYSVTQEASHSILIDTAQNVADSFAFKPLTFGAAGEYTYLVKQQIGNIQGVTYDPATYEVTVSVTDNGVGGFDTAMTVTLDGAVVDGIAFVGTFTQDTATTVTTTTTKAPTEKPTAGSGPQKDSPKTGDSGDAVEWLWILVMSAAVLAAASVCGTARRRGDHID